MKYKVGDKVLIKSVLVEGNFYGEHSVNEDMLEFCNKICTISEAADDHYVLMEDPDSWWWTDEMIDGKISYVAYEKEVVEYMKKDILRQKEIEENKENIKMANTDLIQNKLEKEVNALHEAERKEIENKFYETSIGKAAKAFNEALNQYGNKNQKENWMLNINDLMERSEEYYDDEICAKYRAQREEVREYYREAIALFENADTYEQKHEILTAYGILKGPKATKVRVEGVEK